MKVSASIELIWNLAAQETIASEYKSIEPEHLLAAVLKFSELPVEEVNKMGAGAEAAKQLAMEVSAVRQELTDRAIKSTSARQQIRARLGKGNQPYEGGVMHRSEASRNLFDAAARLTAERGEDTLSAQHLLDAILISPSPVMVRVLGNAVGPTTPRQTPTPLLAKFGKDLTEMVHNEKLLPGKIRAAESKVLIEFLEREQCQIVLLVTDNEEYARSVVMEATKAIVSHENYSRMRGKRVVDITDLKPYDENAEDAMSLLRDLLAQAAKAPEVILYIPAIEATACFLEGNKWEDLIKDILNKGKFRCICRVAPAAYCERMEKDPVWKRLAEAIWVNQATQEEIPWEL